MSEKSYVSMETKICEVCGHEYNTDAILLNKRLKENMDRTTCTGGGLCEDHQKLFDDDYIALVEISNNNTDGVHSIKQENANRTGRICHIRRKVATDIFQIDIKDDLVMMFVDSDTISKLEEMMEPSDEE